MPIPPLSRGSPRQAPAPALRGPGRFGSLRLPSRMEEAARRGGRAVEGARLESVYTGNRIAGSNPAPSATISYCFHWCFYLLGWIRTGAEFPRLCGGRIGRRGRQRPLSDRRYAANAARISVGRCWSTARKMMRPHPIALRRIPGRKAAGLAMNVVPEAKRPSRGCSRSSPAGSGEAEPPALLRPGERQAGMGEQLLRGEVVRMAAFEDRPGDVRGEIA